MTSVNHSKLFSKHLCDVKMVAGVVGKVGVNPSDSYHIYIQKQLGEPCPLHMTWAQILYISMSLTSVQLVFNC